LSEGPSEVPEEQDVRMATATAARRAAALDDVLRIMAVIVRHGHR
jgi:hypothetical protein